MTTRKALALVVAFCAPAVAVVAIGARSALIDSRPVSDGVITVHAGQSGLEFNTRALSGRVALIASSTRVRWRILDVTGWRQSSHRVLTKSWDTSTVPDGRYYLQLERGRTANTQVLFVRNHTYLPPTQEANASVGLNRRDTDPNSVVGVFTHRSYRPGETAVLKLWYRYPPFRLEVLQCGPEKEITLGDDTIEGVTVAGPFTVAGNHGTVRVHIGDWESGVYAVRMISGSKVGYAVFIVRPRRLGTQPVAVVEPTNTWQAYNYRDKDGDGKPDTWYFWWGKRPWVDELRPFLNHGVPPHFRRYDVTFRRWLVQTGRHVDTLAQEDIEHVSGDKLAKLYKLIIFPGHHEYVTAGEFNAVERYRNLGGHLAFLSANDFFWRVNREGQILHRVALWRDIGRPEAALVGVQYFTWDQGKFGPRPYMINGADRTPWLFQGTGLQNGAAFGYFGTEADRVTPHSPKSLRVLATIPNIFNSGHAAAMTYYETPSGGRVFATGAFTLAGPHIRCANVAQLLANLWDKLADEPTQDRYAQANLGACPY